MLLLNQPTYTFSPVISIEYNSTKLEIYSDHIELIGDKSKNYKENIKSAVVGLISYIQLNFGTENIILNNILEIDIKENKLIYLGENPSDTMLTLIQEFKKATDMKAFW